MENAEGNEQLLQEAYIFLTEKRYPNGCTELRKRVIRKKALKFVVKDGELFYKTKKGKVKTLTACGHACSYT